MLVSFLESLRERWSSLSVSQRRLALAVVVGGSALALVKRRRKKTSKKTVPKKQSLAELTGLMEEKGSVQSVTDAGGCLLRSPATVGIGSQAPVTVPSLIEAVCKNETRALAWEPEGANGAKVTQFLGWTWKEYVMEIKRAAAAMVKLGMKPRESCAVIGFNSKEWLISDLAAIYAGGFATGIYATNGVEAVRYILEHSKSRICVCDGMKQAEKAERALFRGASDNDKKAPQRTTTCIVVYGADKVPAEHEQVAKGKWPFMPWQDFMAFGAKDSDSSSEVTKRSVAQTPGDCCTLIYTSGTTGTPKAVMISHDNITWIVASFAELVDFSSVQKHRLVSYLPLSHIAAQAIDVYAGLCTVGTGQVEEATLYFARPDALKGSLKTTLVAVRPTVFFAVPRVFEKFAEALRAAGAQSSGAKKALATWAKSVAKKRYDRFRADGDDKKSIGLVGKLSEVVALKILSAVHAAIGLDQAYFIFTGAAPIAVSTLEYFGSLGLTVNEAFGMSEVTGPSSVTLNNYYLPGSCGVACPGVDIKLEHLKGRDKPGEGEVCFRGRSVMMGYLDNPDKTQESIDDEGWLHSGDTGRLVTPQKGAAPLLKIVGRIKELLITAGGENVAPVPVEDAIRSKLPGIVNDVVVVGDRLKFLSVLFTLQQKTQADGTFVDSLADKARDVDPDCQTAKDAQKNSTWTQLLQDAIDDYNNNDAVSQAQKIQRFAILPLGFTQNTGELTPTLKLKRSVVVDKYATTLNKIYGTNTSAVWLS